MSRFLKAVTFLIASLGLGPAFADSYISGPLTYSPFLQIGPCAAGLGTDLLCTNGTTSLGNVNVTSSTVPTLGIFANGVSLAFSTAGTQRALLSSASFNSSTTGGARTAFGAAACPGLVAFAPSNSATTTGYSGDGTKLCGVIAGVETVDWTATREIVFGGFTFGAALTSNNPGTAGISAIQTTANLTDSGTTGTTAALYANVFGGNTILATNTKTYTLEASTYFKADIAGTGATFTANYAAGADSLIVGTSNPFTVSTTGVVAAIGQITTGGVLGLRQGGTILSSPTNASLQFGAADVDTAPVAQTLRFQGPLVGGTSNVAGPNTTIICGGLGKGNANSGDCIFQTGGPVGASGTTLATATTALTIKGVTQAAIFTGPLILPVLSATPTLSGTQTALYSVRGTSGAGFCSLTYATSTNVQVVVANVPGGC